MCEYCGCQSLDVIAELTQEHDLLRVLGRELVAAVDAASAARVATQMLAVLSPHTATEEGGLFPALAQDFPDQIDNLFDDHRRIEANLAQLCRGADPMWNTVATRVVGELFDHILKEQDGVFPAALSTLTPVQWDGVAAARTRSAGEPARADP
jgi:hemerythrin-like domain-containing protein